MPVNDDFNAAAPAIFPPKPAHGELIAAVQLRDAEAVKDLLQRGANVDEQSESGQTPLMWAARFGLKEIVLMLLDKGATIDMVDNSLSTAQTLAKRFSESEIERIITETALTRENAAAEAARTVVAAKKAQEEQARQITTAEKHDLLRDRAPRLTIRSAAARRAP